MKIAWISPMRRTSSTCSKLPSCSWKAPAKMISRQSGLLSLNLRQMVVFNCRSSINFVLKVLHLKAKKLTKKTMTRKRAVASLIAAKTDLTMNPRRMMPRKKKKRLRKTKKAPKMLFLSRQIQTQRRRSQRQVKMERSTTPVTSLKQNARKRSSKISFQKSDLLLFLF